MRFVGGGSSMTVEAIKGDEAIHVFFTWRKVTIET